jgi:uncharacterized protein
LTKLEWAAVFAGLNILIHIALTFGVIRARQKHKILLGDGGNPDMLRAIRAHGNATETIPLGVAALILLAILDAVPLLGLLVVGGLLTVGRFLHAIGLSGTSGVSFGRAVGTLATGFALIGAAGLLLWAGLSPLL